MYYIIKYKNITFCTLSTAHLKSTFQNGGKKPLNIPMNIHQARSNKTKYYCQEPYHDSVSLGSPCPTN